MKTQQVKTSGKFRVGRHFEECLFLNQKTAKMEISKSIGVTETESLLARLCNGTFLELWNYPNPYKSDRKELCDLLAIFEDNVFIFFDRENLQLQKNEGDLEVRWRRWYEATINRQIRSANGAANYLRKNGKIYLDNKLERPFPFKIVSQKITIHKIIIAHGAKEACLGHSPENISGSLAISYARDSDAKSDFPFMISLDREDPVHVFDSHTLPIILKELDTFYDFTQYLAAKTKAIKQFQFLSYCAEEDLLANYYRNYDANLKEHFIGTQDLTINGLSIDQGWWVEFTKTEAYEKKKIADRTSYLWDEIIQRTSRNIFTNTITGNGNAFKGESAIVYMAKEPRFSRRNLSQRIIKAAEEFPNPKVKGITTYLSYASSFWENVGYVFLQVHLSSDAGFQNDYRKLRTFALEVACGMAKIRFPQLKRVIGIATEPLRLSSQISEDLMVLDCSTWSEEMSMRYKADNSFFNFFHSDFKYENISNFPT